MLALTQNDITKGDFNKKYRQRPRASGFYYILLFLLLSYGSATSQTSKKEIPQRWWSDVAESSLAQSGSNRQELERSLSQVPVNQREGLQFLLENMPQRDLQTLTADFLLDNTALAYNAFQEAPWARDVPDDLFLNDVLPYVCTTEDRDNWRHRLYEISMPVVKDCKTPLEACRTLNEQLFRILNVKYSTKRRVPDQGPVETMQTGVATCTGLSILLVDACRSVGVPARIAGTPLWYDKSGNHTWVEVWDKEWFFTGAAEQSPDGFNRGWFVGNASKAVRDDRQRAVYASSFKKTGITFPMVWNMEADYVCAVNVTDRYTQYAKPEAAFGLSLKLDVLDRPFGERVAAKVSVVDSTDPLIRFDAVSKGDTADMNDHLSFNLPKQKTYIIEAEYKSHRSRQYYTTGTASEDKLLIFLSGVPDVPASPGNSYIPQPVTKSIGAKMNARLKDEVTAYFTASENQKAGWKFSRNLERLLLNNEPAVRQAVWEAYTKAPVHDSLRLDFESKQVRFKNHISPYTVKTVGTRPANGWALFIAMHGGGNAPQELNDSQWRHMQIYYRDHPEAGGYIYVALRAPDNSWNGFYTGYTYPLVQNLLRQFMLFGDIDPDKKFIMGYSHGGYGAFAIGPKMPDYFAAIHASAAAPADDSVPVTLRNTVFTTMIGELDTMYGRYDRIMEFDKEVLKLKGDRNDIYPVTVQVVADSPHSGLPDRDKISEMYPHVRNPVPRDLTWQLTDGVIRDFFWLSASNPEPGKRFDVTCTNNYLKVTSDLATASILLDSRLIDFKKTVTLDFNGTITAHKLKPSLYTLCKSMERRGDPELAFTAEIKPEK